MSLFRKPKHLAVYTRVSTEEQKTGLKLLDLKDYVKKRGIPYIRFTKIYLRCCERAAGARKADGGCKEEKV
jgi:DNA invertase Pin-like site-specific DNA recombinase